MLMPRERPLNLETREESTRQSRRSSTAAHLVEEHIIANALVAPDYSREVGFSSGFRKQTSAACGFMRCSGTPSAHRTSLFRGWLCRVRAVSADGQSVARVLRHDRAFYGRRLHAIPQKGYLL
jgi:hypothetical protein